MAVQIVVGVVLGLTAIRALSVLCRIVDSVYGRITAGFDLHGNSRTRLDRRALRALSPD